MARNELEIQHRTMIDINGRRGDATTITINRKDYSEERISGCRKPGQKNSITSKNNQGREETVEHTVSYQLGWKFKSTKSK